MTDEVPIKGFTSQGAKDAAINRAKRALVLSTALAAKYEQLHKEELQEIEDISNQLKRMQEAPVLD